MPVVSNTSPVLNLAIIQHLNLLREQHQEIWIPPAVLDELRVSEPLPGTAVLRDALAAGWLKVVAVANAALVTVLRRDLDRGEAEAIALALQCKADWLLLDEREARQVARRLELPVIGVLGILLRARQTGQIAALRPVLVALQEQAGFRLAPELWETVLRNVGEVS